MMGSTETARNVYQDEKTAIVHVQGEIDMTTSPLLRSCIAECLGQGCTEVTLDTSHLFHRFERYPGPGLAAEGVTPPRWPAGHPEPTDHG
jgi:hypothetical protein